MGDWPKEENCRERNMQSKRRERQEKGEQNERFRDDQDGERWNLRLLYTLS